MQFTSTKKVEAIQLNNDKFDLNFENWAKKNNLLYISSRVGDIMISTDDGETFDLQVSVGEWIVLDGDDIVVMYDDEFKEKYSSIPSLEGSKGSLSFGDALVALEAGKKVTRKDWNGKGMHVFMRPSDVLPKDFIPKVKSLPESSKNHLIKQNKDIKFTAYFCMYNAQGIVINGWMPTVTDLLSKEWVILG